MPEVNLKCKNCNSQDVLNVPNNSYINRNYTKITKRGNVTETETGGKDFRIRKYACLECGHVFEQMDPKDLAEYHELKKYFD